MAEIIRFYADQHYPAPVTAGLMRRGIDMLTAQEANLCGANDPDQLPFATSQDRVLTIGQVRRLIRRPFAAADFRSCARLRTAFQKDFSDKPFPSLMLCLERSSRA